MRLYRARTARLSGSAAISRPRFARGQTSIAWVWDVYDRDQKRALRLSGEEQAGKGGRDAWATADDLVLRRIAQAGLTGLNGMINGTTPGEQPACADVATDLPSPVPMELPVQATRICRDALTSVSR